MHTKFEEFGCRNHPNELLQVMGKTGDSSTISGYHRQRWVAVKGWDRKREVSLMFWYQYHEVWWPVEEMAEEKPCG
ncbi:unnamed protein product [Prunus armeniaca]